MKARLAILSIMFLFAFCKEDDDPTIEVSSIEGTLQGTLADETALNEPFRFEIAKTATEQFDTQADGSRTITLSRSESLEGAAPIVSLTLRIPAGGTINDLEFNETPAFDNAFYLYYKKQVSDFAQLEIYGTGFNSLLQMRSISLSANEKYKFSTDTNGRPLIKENVSRASQQWQNRIFTFTNTSGDSIYYSLEINTSNLIAIPFRKVRYADGSVSTTSDLYGSLFFVPWGSKDYFAEVATSKKLYEQFDALKEAREISNVQYDEQTGKLRFDFSLTLDKDNPTNTTKHPLTVSGTFDSGPGKVYTNVLK